MTSSLRSFRNASANDDGATLPIIDFSSLSRSPDIRLFDLRFDTIRLKPPFSVSIDEPDRTMFYHVRHGAAWLNVGDQLIHAPVGTIIGVETGRHHVWRHARRRTTSRPIGADEMLPMANDIPVADGECELVMSSTHHREAILLKLDNGLFVIRDDGDADYAVMTSLLSAQYRELGLGERHDFGIVRRLSEAITLCLVRYARKDLEEEWGHLPKRLQHDERILRAFIAFTRKPSFPWSLETLAEIAGLSRTAFAVRFKAVVGEPPLECLKRLRVKRAAALLNQGRSTLNVIAQAVGYANASSLTRSFRTIHGVTPGEWRSRERSSQIG